MAIDGYADETIEVPGFGEDSAGIRTDRSGGFAYNHNRYGNDPSFVEWGIVVLNNRRVEYQVPWLRGGWDMTIGREGSRWIVTGGDNKLEMYRDGNQVVNDGNVWLEGLYENDAAVARSPSQYNDDAAAHNAILPVFDRGGEFQVYAPHDHPIPENPDEVAEAKLYSLDESYTNNNGCEGVYAAGSRDDGAYLFLVDRGSEVRMFSVKDRWDEYYGGMSDEELQENIDLGNVDRVARLNVDENGVVFDYPSEIDPYGIQITPVADDNRSVSDGVVAAVLGEGGDGYVFDGSGVTRLDGLSGLDGVGLDPEGRYVSAFNTSRGVVWDRESGYEIVLDTAALPNVDSVRGVEWNDGTRELLVLWGDTDAEQRYASFFGPPFEETFADANRPLREMVTATCIVPDGEYTPGDTVEIAAEFDNESYDPVDVSATWTIAGTELSAEGIIDARGTGRISDRLTIGNVETEETGTELDVQMEWSVTRRDGE